MVSNHFPTHFLTQDFVACRPIAEGWQLSIGWQDDVDRGSTLSSWLLDERAPRVDVDRLTPGRLHCWWQTQHS